MHNDTFCGIHAAVCTIYIYIMIYGGPTHSVQGAVKN